MDNPPEQHKLPRRVFCVRVSETAHRFITGRAGSRGVRPSEEARIMLTYSATFMPMGWEPPGYKKDK